MPTLTFGAGVVRFVIDALFHVLNNRESFDIHTAETVTAAAIQPTQKQIL
jgi:hypothetical protein